MFSSIFKDSSAANVINFPATLATRSIFDHPVYLSVTLIICHQRKSDSISPRRQNAKSKIEHADETLREIFRFSRRVESSNEVSKPNGVSIANQLVAQPQSSAVSLMISRLCIIDG
jgi:hypothetical protein